MKILLEQPNTVKGITERDFCEGWCSILWRAMLSRGRGYKKSSQRHTGRRMHDGTWDRRADKIAAMERHQRAPVFTGKLNYRRSERPVA